MSYLLNSVIYHAIRLYSGLLLLTCKNSYFFLLKLYFMLAFNVGNWYYCIDWEPNYFRSSAHELLWHCCPYEMDFNVM